MLSPCLTLTYDMSASSLNPTSKALSDAFWVAVRSDDVPAAVALWQANGGALLGSSSLFAFLLASNPHFQCCD
jgi:hypothetical protein